MERPCLSRRHALLFPATAAGLGGLAACAPEDEGFGTAEPLRAEDGTVPLEEIPENASTLVNFGGQRHFVPIVRGAWEAITAYSCYCTHNGCALRQEEAALVCPSDDSLLGAATRVA